MGNPGKSNIVSTSNSLPGYGPVRSANRLVEPVLSKSKETRMPGRVGAGGEKPPATRLDRLSRESRQLLEIESREVIINRLRSPDLHHISVFP